MLATYIVAGIGGLVLHAQAHMLLSKPPMFPSGDVPDNGPLVGHTGVSNYPCKNNGASSVYDFSFPRTQMPLGSNYTLVLQGEAVHGGGSCQLSLTKDLQPTKDSVFKVIHSIEGGCPARNTPGNLGEDAKQIDPFTYDFEIPNDLDAGDYTFAWTWFNKIGNREMYMNCAPITITGAPGKRDVEERDASAFDALPNMFLANIPEVDCYTADSMDLMFPDPGASVETNTPNVPAAPLVLSGGSVSACYAPPGKASGPAAAPSGASASPTAPSPAATSNAPTPAAPSSAEAPALTIVPVTLTTTTTVAMPSVTAGAPALFNTGSTACPAGSQPCSNVGGVVCIGSDQFGLCDINNCAVAQPLAAGTTCSNGVIARRGLRMPPHARRGLY